jgi:hypothetical protein
MKTIISVVAVLCLSVMAQDFSDGYSRSIKLGIFYNDTLNQNTNDTLSDSLKPRSKSVVILLKDFGDN